MLLRESCDRPEVWRGEITPKAVDLVAFRALNGRSSELRLMFSAAAVCFSNFSASSLISGGHVTEGLTAGFCMARFPNALGLQVPWGPRALQALSLNKRERRFQAGTSRRQGISGRPGRDLTGPAAQGREKRRGKRVLLLASCCFASRRGCSVHRSMLKA